MSQFLFSELKREFGKHHWKLKTQMDDKCVLLDHSGNKMVFDTVDDVQAYYQQLLIEAPSFTLHPSLQQTDN